MIKRITIQVKRDCNKASLTLEAAFVMPIFLYFLIAFLYFIQIFTLQEQIQSRITKMGLNLSKVTYFYKDFSDIKEIINFDNTVFGKESDFGLEEITDRMISSATLKLYAQKYLDQGFINHSCIKNGFDGMDFSLSSIAGDEDVIDIIVQYKVTLPVKIFLLGDMGMLQRVRLRAWTGYTVAAVYSKEESVNKETLVYITSTGSVYHKSTNCSHIKLSVTAVHGIPYLLRNESGAKYQRCEACCEGELDQNATYYITTYGTRYHSDRNCSKIKRNVTGIPFSEVGSRKPCSRCCN